MDNDSLVRNVNKYLGDKHVCVDVSWIREQVTALNDQQRSDACDVIYKRVLECDWKVVKTPFGKLPNDLDLLLFNEHKRTFSGNYVLQISGIVDISRAFTDKPEQEEDDEDDNDEVTENELAKLMKGKSSAPKKTEKRSWSNGKRCLELTLFDGRKNSIAIEYTSIRELNDNLLGAKVLLSGPFDVFAGVILLQQQNIKLLSDMTFYPQVADQNDQNANNVNNNANNNVNNNVNNNQPEEENYDFLMDDDLDLMSF